MPLLQFIEKVHVDLSKDNLQILEKFDLVIGWTVDYALDRSTLLNLFCSAQKFSTSILLCNQQIIGLMRYVTRKIKMRSFESQKVLKDGVRLHGWCRSLRYWKKIADISHMQMEVIKLSSRGLPRDAVFNYMLFTPILGH